MKSIEKKRLIAAVFGLIAAASVITQYFISSQREGLSFLENSIRYFSYFTILTNTLVAKYMLVIAFGRPRGLHRLMSAPGFLSSLLLHMAIVALVFHVVLSHLYDFEGLTLVLNQMFHTVVPIFVLLFWLFFEDKAAVPFASIGKWLLYPLIYSALVMLRGVFSGFYPYFFLDIGEIGGLQTAINMLAVAAFFALMGSLIIAVGKKIDAAKKRGEA